MFICGLHNNNVNICHCTATNDGMIIKGWGRKRFWPNFPGQTEENDQNLYSDYWDMNLRSRSAKYNPGKLIYYRLWSIPPPCIASWYSKGSSRFFGHCSMVWKWNSVDEMFVTHTERTAVYDGGSRQVVTLNYDDDGDAVNIGHDPSSIRARRHSPSRWGRCNTNIVSHL
jgi:hypothetical protein